MTGWSCGNSFGSNSSSVASTGDGPVRRVPPWKFGVGPAAMSDDRRGL